jgi:hypothetical protein
VLVEKARLGFQRFLRFRNVEPIPKGVWHRVEDHQSGVHARAQKRTMKVRRAAEAVIASRRHAKSRWESFQVRIHRRKQGVLAVVISDLGDHAKAFQRFDHGAEVFETAGAVNPSGVAVAGEVDVPGEEAEHRRQGWEFFRI